MFRFLTFVVTILAVGVFSLGSPTDVFAAEAESIAEELEAGTDSGLGQELTKTRTALAD